MVKRRPCRDELAGITDTALGKAPKIEPTSTRCLWGDGAGSALGEAALAPHLCLSWESEGARMWYFGTRPFPRRQTQLCSARGCSSSRAEENMEPTASHHPVPAPTISAPQGITAAPLNALGTTATPHREQTALLQSQKAAPPSPG